MNKINSVLSFANDTDKWQSDMKTTAYAKNFENMLGDAKKMYRTWLDTKDYITKNKFISWSNLNSLAGAIVTYAGTKWKFDDYADLEASEIVEKFLDKNKDMWFENYVNEYTWWEISLAEASNKMGMTQVHYSSPDVFSEDIDDYDFDPTLLSDYNPEDWADTLWEPNISDDSMKGRWILASLLFWAWADVWLNYLWKWLQSVGKTVYSQSFSPSLREASKTSSLWWKKLQNELDVKAAKDNLKNAKKTWEWVEEATEALAQAEQKAKSFKNMEIRTVSESARDNWLWTDITRWWMAWWERWRAAEAKWRASNIFNSKINKFLEESDDTVNVKELINSLEDDINKVASVHPWKQKEYTEALDTLKEMFSDEKFSNLPVKDVQKLKEEIWSGTPQKFFKGKELSNEYKELEWILGSKLRDALHASLTKTAWEDTAKLYLDYANLMDYAKTQDALATKWLSFRNIKDTLTETAWQKWGKALNAAWEFLEDNTKGNLLKKIWNAIYRNKWKAGGIKWWVFDVVGMMQLLSLLPWTIWDTAEDFINSTPAWVADTELSESTFWKRIEKLWWNYSSDDERIDFLKENLDSLYWEDIPREDVEYTYKKWKWKNDWNLRFSSDLSLVWWEKDSALPIVISSELGDIDYEKNRMKETEYKLLWDKAKTEKQKIDLIMRRYLVDEEKAKSMLKYMTDGWDYNQPWWKWIKTKPTWYIDDETYETLLNMDLTPSQREKINELRKKLQIDENLALWIYSEA